MAFYNVLTGYVNVKDLSKETFDKIMKKIDCAYRTMTEDGEEFYKFIYKRRNHFSMSNGTAARLDFSGVTDDDVDLVVQQLKDTVDNII